MNEHDPLNDAITQALETKPTISVPDDFAARVMARVPQTRRAVAPSISRGRYGRFALLCAMPLLVVAMLVLAPATHDSVLWLCMQTMLFAELAGIVLWFGWLRGRA
jgi:hypothetical protein